MASKYKDYGYGECQRDDNPIGMKNVSLSVKV